MRNIRKSFRCDAVITFAAAVAAALMVAGSATAQVDKYSKARREHIEKVTSQTLGARNQTMSVTSRDRKTPSSKAHDRGAIDIRGTNYGNARAISGALGRGHTVIVEQPHYPPVSPRYQISSSYRNGRPVSSRPTPLHATAPHTHIQPDSNPNSGAPRPRTIPVRSTQPRPANILSPSRIPNPRPGPRPSMGSSGSYPARQSRTEASVRPSSSFGSSRVTSPRSSTATRTIHKKAASH